MGSILSTHGKKNSPSPRNTTHPNGIAGVADDGAGSHLTRYTLVVFGF